jgi:alpha/beta hydrolase fold
MSFRNLRYTTDWRIAMPTFEASPDLRLHYLVDDFTEPWTEPETILLLHGNAESSLAWYAWVPLLARRFRVVRPDMRGYGASTPMPRDFAWTLDIIIDDYARLMDWLGVQRFTAVQVSDDQPDGGHDFLGYRTRSGQPEIRFPGSAVPISQGSAPAARPSARLAGQ